MEKDQANQNQTGQVEIKFPAKFAEVKAAIAKIELLSAEELEKLAHNWRQFDRQIAELSSEQVETYRRSLLEIRDQMSLAKQKLQSVQDNLKQQLKEMPKVQQVLNTYNQQSKQYPQARTLSSQASPGQVLEEV